MRTATSPLRPLVSIAVALLIAAPAAAQCSSGVGPTIPLSSPRSDPYLGPGDTVPTSGPGSGAPTGPVTGGPSTGGATPGNGPRPQGPTTGGSAPPSAPGPVSTGSGVAGDTFPNWRVWWEFHKFDYLVRHSLGGLDFTGEEGTVSGASVQRLLRARQLTAAALQDDAAMVRGAACILWGRIGSDDVLDPLLERLDDPSRSVRHAALLGMGLSGRRETVAPLFAVARHATLQARDHGTITNRASFFALVGLALGRRHGLGLEVDAAVAHLGSELGDDESIDLGLCYYQSLNEVSLLDERALRALDNKGTRLEIRCRSAEGLRHNDGEDGLIALVRALDAPQLDLRRSAALSLGDVPASLVVEPLIERFGKEKEQLSKAYLLIAIARQGGDAAAEVLERTARYGGSGLRPWSFLADGISARQHGNSSALARLRLGLKRSSGSEQRAAAVLAMGMARDSGSVPLLVEHLHTSGSEIEREMTAVALGMIGGSRAREALRSAYADERSPRVRAAICQGLGQIGSPDDATFLVAALRDFGQPELRIVAATSLGFHGSLVALDGLLDVLDDDAAPIAARVASLEACGLLLEDGPTLLVGELSRLTNPYAMPDWVTMLWTSAL